MRPPDSEVWLISQSPCVSGRFIGRGYVMKRQGLYWPIWVVKNEYGYVYRHRHSSANVVVVFLG